MFLLGVQVWLRATVGSEGYLHSLRKQAKENATELSWVMRNIAQAIVVEAARISKMKQKR